jgi:hypothetical protein
MKRDMDLIRRILLDIEAQEDPEEDIELDSGGKSEQVIQYHLHLLYDGGFINAHEISPMTAAANWYQPLGLTWKGHEFLDDIRNDTVWNKTKEKVGAQVGTVSLAVLQEVAKATVKSLLGLP